MTRATTIGIAASAMCLAACSAEMSGGTGFHSPSWRDAGPNADTGPLAPPSMAPIAPPPAPRPAGPTTPAAATETCGNGIDDDRNGRIDDGCGCDPGASQRCFGGDARAAGVGPCTWGSQRCEGDVEFPAWGACIGAVLPSAELCNDGIDQDCNGVLDDGFACVCSAGDTEPCYPGAWDEVGRGRCRAGTRPCDPTGTEFGACEGAIGPMPETCNDLDDDCDGAVDEGLDCRPPPVPCLDAEGSPWQQWLDTRVHCFGEDLDEDPDEFDHADIPAAGSSVWGSRGSLGIDFSDDSTIPGRFCDGAHTGGVFTYFQTFVALSSAPSRFVLRNGGTDDGVQVWIFNSRHPAGRTSDDWTFFESGGVADLTAHAVVGENRIVLIHIDDNPTRRALHDVRLEIAGGRLGDCS